MNDQENLADRVFALTEALPGLSDEQKHTLRQAHLALAERGSDWPEHYEELGRKVTEQTEILARLHDKGRIDSKTAYLCALILHRSISGLVDWEVCRVLEVMMAVIGRKKH